jgi:type 1 glutamine amidotransferase
MVCCEGCGVSGRLLAITGGHRFDLDAFRAMLDDVAEALGWQWAHAVQPHAQQWLQPEHAGRWDAIVLYDIPGLALQRGEEPIVSEPPDDVVHGVLELRAAGQGFVALHHALAGWPAWDAWADTLGGRFLYAPGLLHGEPIPASGYRMDRYTVEIDASDHPVCAGVEPFEVDDELYLCPVLEAAVTPLLTTTADLSPASMIDVNREVRYGERVAAADQRGSSLVGWTTDDGGGRLVYLLPGHGAGTMAHPEYRKLLVNACRWVSASS